MSIPIGDNFEKLNTKPNFTNEQYDTIASLKLINDNFMPDTKVITCVEDGNVYIYNKSNPIDSVYGKCRKIKVDDINVFVDVDALPTTNIKDNVIYRLNKGSIITGWKYKKFNDLNKDLYTTSYDGITEKSTGTLTTWNDVNINVDVKNSWEDKMDATTLFSEAQAVLTPDGVYPDFNHLVYYKIANTYEYWVYCGGIWKQFDGLVFTDVTDFHTESEYETTIQRKHISSVVTSKYDFTQDKKDEGWTIDINGITNNGGTTYITFSTITNEWDTTYNSWFIEDNNGKLIKYVSVVYGKTKYGYSDGVVYPSDFSTYQCKFCKNGVLYSLGVGNDGGMYLGTVNSLSNLPTTRPGGVELEDGDYVKPSSILYPFTTADGKLTFNTKQDKGVYVKLTNTWSLEPGINTSEILIKNKTDESISGNSEYQSDVNKEVVKYIKQIKYNFTTATNKWSVTHDLEKYPNVTTFDENNNLIIGAVDYTDENKLEVNFEEPQKGTLVLN